MLPIGDLSRCRRAGCLCLQTAAPKPSFRCTWYVSPLTELLGVAETRAGCGSAGGNRDRHFLTLQLGHFRVKEQNAENRKTRLAHGRNHRPQVEDYSTPCCRRATKFSPRWKPMPPRRRGHRWTAVARVCTIGGDQRREENLRDGLRHRLFHHLVARAAGEADASSTPTAIPSAPKSATLIRSCRRRQTHHGAVGDALEILRKKRNNTTSSSTTSIRPTTRRDSFGAPALKSEASSLPTTFSGTAKSANRIPTPNQSHPRIQQMISRRPTCLRRSALRDGVSLCVKK